MKKVLALALFCLVFIPPLTTQAEQPHDVFVVEADVFNPCTEEGVHVMALMHEFTNVTCNGKRCHEKSHANIMEAVAVGLDSEDAYYVEGTENETENSSLVNPQETYTWVQNFTMTHADSGVQAVGKMLEHYTINANGEMTSDVSMTIEECID